MKPKFTNLWTLSIALVLTFITTSIAAGLPGQPVTQLLAEEALYSADIDPALLAQLDSEGQADFFVWMVAKADLSPAYNLTTKEEKGVFVFETLVEVAETTQQDLRDELDHQGIAYRPFYIANKIYVYSGNQELVTELAARSDVARIVANSQFQLQEPFINPRAPESSLVIESNITFVRAPEVWAMGFTGEGITLAGNDTGLMWNHPAIINQYRGWDGVTADHNYNWWDATGTYPTVPDDGHGHGTHTTGTMVGDDGGANQIGVAPGAKTVHCKNMTNTGSGSDFTFTTCFEWDLAPWDLTGANPNPLLAPHAINNSWGYFGGNQPQFEDEIAALRAAGIVVEVSSGNEGPSCGTLRSPGDYAQSLTTGSVNHFSGTLPGTITGFSSRGPSGLHPGSFIPDIMAPGENIRSSIPGGGYQGGWSGTSMSGPHVTALVALMWSASPGILGDVDLTEQIIVDTAVPLTGQNGSNCGGDYTTGPNNDWGYGTMDSLAAVEEAILAGGPFRLDITPTSLDACVPDNAVYFIDVLQNEPGFTDPVTLAVFGVPAGYTPGFSTNPVVPPGDSVLTLTGGAATFGSYSLDVVGTSATDTATTTVGLNLYTAVPGGVTLMTPADGATNIDLSPTFSWSSATQAGTYFLEVATDSGFADIVYSATTTGESHAAAVVLDSLSTYYWRVTANNACGAGTMSATFSFTTRDIPPILLVDDDDNSPDVRSHYTTILDSLGLFYDIWDTNGSDNEPSAAQLAPYDMVIWFTGVSFGGAAGPGAAGEAALASWLDSGNCLFISSQDYLWDRGLTSFMQSHLGVATFTNDVGQTTVTGAGSLFGGLGPYPLTYPFTNYSDRINPDASAEVAFVGNQQNAAVNKDAVVYRSTFWGFPFEAMSVAAREETLQVVVDWCGAGGAVGTLAGTVTDGDSGDPISGATVEAGSRSATTNNDGEYSMALPVGSYDVTASAANYQPATVMGIDIITDTTTIQNFVLVGSHLTYSPAFIEETMEIGDVVTNTVTVTNTGPLPIDWNVTIGNYAGPVVVHLSSLDSLEPANVSGENSDAIGAVSDLASLAESAVHYPDTPFTLPNTTANILLNQAPNQVNGLFADSGCDLCGTGAQSIAENFVLANTATIGGVNIWSGYFPTDTPLPDNITVIFRENAGGLPGAVLYSETGVANVRTQTGVILFGVHEYFHEFTLASAVTLDPGTYWVELFNATGFGTDDYFWETGNLDPVNGLAGSAWATATPGVSWNFDGVTNLAIQLVEGSPSGAWASAVPNSGTVPAGASVTFELVFDATELLEIGTYTAELNFSGDFENDPPVMPLTMHLEEPEAAISLDVTVSIDNECGTADMLMVDVGTVVYYCYTVTNMGNMMLPNHTITDSVWGHIDTFVYNLLPGETESMIYPQTIMADVVSTATWEASYPDYGLMTWDTDDVTVMVNVYSVDLAPATAAQSGAPGSEVVYELTVTNNGNATDVISFSATGYTWMVDLPDPVMLDAGESATVMVTVTIPANAGNGDSDSVTVTATSAGDGSMTASSDLTTTAEIEGYVLYLPFIIRP